MSKHSHKLNILQLICPTGFYGAERWILALANGLDQGRIHCDLACTREFDGEIEIIQKYRSDHRDLGEAFEIPMSHRFDLGVVNRIAQLIRDRKIDLVHSHGYKSDIIGILAARKAGVKCIITPHGFQKTRDLKLRLFIWLGCKMMKYADMVVPLSPQIVETVRDFGVPSERIHYIQNGIDLSEIESIGNLVDDTKTGNQVKRIGFIGQLIDRKNVSDILETFEILRNKHRDIELLIIGDGDQRMELEKQANSLTHGDCIFFPGFKDNRLDYLVSFDLFTMTSKLEGIPRCMMEAMALGVPVAAYNIPGINQLIIHESTGLLAPFGDKQTLARHWESILCDKDLVTIITENAKRVIYEDFSGKRMATEYTDLYQKLVRVPENDMQAI